MDYLGLVAIGYYIFLGIKVIAQLLRVKFRLKEFYDEKMSFHLGMFVIIHALALILFMVYLIIKGMVHAAL